MRHRWFGSNAVRCCRVVTADTVYNGIKLTAATARRRSSSSSVAERRAPLAALFLALCAEVLLLEAPATDFADSTVVKRDAMSSDTMEVGHRPLVIHHHLHGTGSRQYVGKVLGKSRDTNT